MAIFPPENRVLNPFPTRNTTVYSYYFILFMVHTAVYLLNSLSFGKKILKISYSSSIPIHHPLHTQIYI